MSEEKVIDAVIEAPSNSNIKSSNEIKSKKKGFSKRIGCILAIFFGLVLICGGIGAGFYLARPVTEFLERHNFIEVGESNSSSTNSIEQPWSFNIEDSAKVPTDKSESTKNEETVKSLPELVDESLKGVVTIAIKSSKGGADNIGSGFLVDKSGLVITNQHVVSAYIDPSNYVVIDNNGKEHMITKILRDESNDIAIVQIEISSEDMKSLTVLKVGDSDKVRVGESVVAIGTPLGEFAGTVTTGIISGLKRSVQIDGLKVFENVMQTDAAINPGNSGGPLLNTKGEVIGINFATTSGVNNISFSLPINSASQRLAEYQKYGKFIKPYIGVEYSVVSRLQAVLSGNLYPGAYVENVMQDSPAQKAGLQRGDIIVKVGEVSVDESLAYILGKLKIGQSVELTVYRNGELIKMSLILEEAPA